jgi:hypothetical protein
MLFLQLEDRVCAHSAHVYGRSYLPASVVGQFLACPLNQITDPLAILGYVPNNVPKIVRIIDLAEH